MKVSQEDANKAGKRKHPSLASVMQTFHRAEIPLFSIEHILGFLDISDAMQFSFLSLAMRVSFLVLLRKLERFCLADLSPVPIREKACLNWLIQKAPTLVEINVSNFGCNDQVCALLSTQCETLERFIGGGCYELSDCGISLLCRCPRIQKWYLGGCHLITDAGVSSIAKTPFLRKLYLNHCRLITDYSLEYLGTWCQHLERFYVPGCPEVTDAGVRGLLLRPAVCQSLLVLNVSATSVTDAGLAFLGDFGGSLERLFVGPVSGDLSVDGVQSFLTRRPHCDVHLHNH